MLPCSIAMPEPGKSARVRVLLVIPTLEIGGAEQQLSTLAIALSAAGHSAEVAAFRARGPLLDRLSAARIPVHDLGKGGTWTIALVAARLARLIRQLRPDAVYGFLPTSNVVTAVLKPWLRGTPVVWGVRSSRMDLSRYGTSARIVARLQSVLSPAADAIVFNSDDAFRSAGEQGFRNARLVSIPNGIDTHRFVPDARSRTETRAAWGIRDEHLLVGLVARVDPAKDHETFIAAAARLAAQWSGVRFVCVGGGAAGDVAHVQERARGLGLDGLVRWVPEYRDMLGAYNALDVLVLSSRSEAFPNALAEGMACAVPCVATDVGDVRRLLGDAGVVVPPGDPAAIAEAVSSVLALPPEHVAQLRDRARMRIEQHFSIRALVERTVATIGAVSKR